MYKSGKPNQNSHKYKHTHHENDPKTPPFSSSLLNKANNSLKTHPRKTEQHHLTGAFREDEMSTLRRACLVEKWVEKKVITRGRNPPPPTKRTLLEEFDLQDTLFFSTRTEYSVFLQHHKSNPNSAPSSPRPKPVRTRAPNGPEFKNKGEAFEETRPSSRAQRIYSNLKNLRQPISPGARLSGLIASIFVKDGRKIKNKKERKSEQMSTCSSSASTFSKSCLSRSSSPTSSKNKKFSDGVKRTVRFCPSVTAILDEDDRGRRKFNSGVERESEKQRQIEEVALDLLNGYWDAKLSKSHGHINVNHGHYGVNHGANYGRPDEEEEDNADGLSCSSSDLFELDNLSLIGDELPVYETTKFDPKVM